MKLPSLKDDPQYLEPNAADLYIASHQVGAPCPFCGGAGSFVRPRQNKETGIYIYDVYCTDTNCGASIFANSYDRNDARKIALSKWNTRVNKESHD